MAQATLQQEEPFLISKGTQMGLEMSWIGLVSILKFGRKEGRVLQSEENHETNSFS